jgi:hypothetical protein
MSLLRHHPQCPKCELKFNNKAEMQWHLREDHPLPYTPTSEPVTLTVERPKPAQPSPERPRRLWRFLRSGLRRD